jgi:hypothetical protein
MDRQVEIYGIKAKVPDTPLFEKLGNAWAWRHADITNDILLMEKFNAEVLIFAALAAAQWSIYEDPNPKPKIFTGLVEAENWLDIYAAALRKNKE